MSVPTAPLTDGKMFSGANTGKGTSVTVPVTCKGMTGRLMISAGDGVTFTPSGEPDTRTSSALACCSPGPAPFEIKQEDLIGGSITPGNAIHIWYCKHDGRTPERPVRCLRKSIRLVCANEGAAAQAVQLLREAASPHEKDVQRRLLIIINPCSGRGRARQTFVGHVRPILEAAGFHLDVRETKGPGHATDIVKEAELQIFDAVVAVGGDGTIFEILQGYFHGEDWGARVGTPFCLVPSGSGNALAANCGLWTPQTAAYAICKGRTRALDVFSVVQPPERRYFAFLSIYYGMMANLDIGTDHLRWMGSLRFTLGAIHEVLQQRRYAASVAYLPAMGSSGAQNKEQAVQDRPAQGAIASAHTAAAGARSGSNEANKQSRQHAAATEAIAAAEQSTEPAAASNEAGAAASNGGSAGATPGSCSSAGPPLRLLHALGPEDELQLSRIAETHPDWQLLEPTETSFFAAVNLPLLDFTSRTGPEADFNSGCLDVMYVPEIASRMQGLEWLDVLGKGKHLEGDFTHLRKASALIIEPHSSGTSLVVDGEAIPYKRIYVEVHPSLCNAIVA